MAGIQGFDNYLNYLAEKGGVMPFSSSYTVPIPEDREGIWEASHQPTVEDELRGEKEHLERVVMLSSKRLADIDAALEALEANPEVLRVINLVSRAQRGY